jgi:hypothetical protein
MVVSSRKAGVNYALVLVIARSNAGRHGKDLCAVCTTEAKSTKHQEASEELHMHGFERLALRVKLHINARPQLRASDRKLKSTSPLEL